MERANLYFEANGIKEEKQLAVFLSSIGGKTYELLQNLLAPTLPKDKLLAEVIAVLEKHFDSKPAVIAERFKFHKRDQLPGESLADYVAELQHLTTHCAFGAYLNVALRDHLVCGLRSKGTQRRLLATKDLTLQEAVETALSMEAAEKDSRALQGGKDSSVNQVSSSQAPLNWRQSQPCYHCGKANHHPSKCCFIGELAKRLATLLLCVTLGRVTNCLQTGLQLVADLYGKKSTSTKAHYVETEEVSNALDELHLFAIGTTYKSKPLTSEVVIEGSPIVMEVDTGAEVSIISEDTYKAVFPELQPAKSNVLLKTYTNEVMKVVSELPVKVQYGEQTETLTLIVISGSGPSLLGRNGLQKLQLYWQKMCHYISSLSSEDPPCVQNMLTFSRTS